MYVKLKYMPVIGKLMLKQLICALCCMLFLMIFPAMIDSGIGEIMFSLLAVIVYFDLMYSTTWNIANKHRRDVNIYNRRQQETNCVQICLNNKFGFYCSLLYLFINLILALTCIFMDKFGTAEISVIGNFTYKLWFLEFISLHLRIVRYRYILWLLISAFPSIPVLLGFYSGIEGKNGFDLFVKKLVYKDEEKDSK